LGVDDLILPRRIYDFRITIYECADVINVCTFFVWGQW